MANKRLIDANALLEKMQFRLPINDKTSEVIAECVEITVRYIKNAPTVDAVEVVRCKDCKHRTVTSDGMVCECALPTKRMQDYYIYGSTILARVEPDAFCSYGERKDNERKAD